MVVTDQLAVYPSPDTYIRQDAPTRNYGTATFLRNRSNATGEYRNLLLRAPRLFLALAHQRVDASEERRRILAFAHAAAPARSWLRIW